jgi:thioredoxin reductase (NADPH)
MARSLQAVCDEQGALQVNAHQETTVPRLYAAGDIVRGLDQVVVAAAQGAIAATDIHNKLCGR